MTIVRRTALVRCLVTLCNKNNKYQKANTLNSKSLNPQSLNPKSLNPKLLNTKSLNLKSLNPTLFKPNNVFRLVQAWLGPWVLCLLIVWLSACGPSKPEYTRVLAPLKPPSNSLPAGQHALNLGNTLLINGKLAWRDGILYIPQQYRPEQPLPLMVWLHGGGGHASDTEYMYPIANQYGIIVLALDSRHNTWDGIDSPFGPDVKFIEKALAYTFDHVAVNPKKLALGGLSDGASYTLALGRSNGDVFTHLIAAAPWRLKPPAPSIGKPKIMVVHGTQDNIYPAFHSRQFLVPALRDDGYPVHYYEFDGPHWVPEPVLQKIFTWFTAN